MKHFGNVKKSIHKFEFTQINVQSVKQFLLSLGDLGTVDFLGFGGRLLFQATDFIAVKLFYRTGNYLVLPQLTRVKETEMKNVTLGRSVSCVVLPK